MIKSKKLSSHNIKHGFFNKRGGVSKGIYQSLNCGPGSNDNKRSVNKNLDIVRKKINKNTNEIYLVKQIHSSKFVFIDKNQNKKTKKVEADAIITNKNNLPIGVLTADCVPILISDKKNSIVAAIHAGWKGAYKDIIQKVIKFIVNKGYKSRDLIAAIGPCISQNNYEVKYDFKKKFLKKNPKNKIFFRIIKNKIYFNLRNFVKNTIKHSGVNKIDVLNKDTFNIKNNYFSARRATHLKEKDYGRNISLIMINSKNS